jgi:phenylalanyl-tRNA synthetase beta chain
MKISLNWLRNYIDVTLPAEKIAELLTNCGLEVESFEKYETVRGGLKGIIIGEVLEKQKHPNADRLTVTKVNTGSGELLQIVCGAPNVDVGQKVVVALVGSTLFPTTGEPFEIKKSKIRGEISEGMICAENEIGFGTSHEGIMVLNNSAKVGTAASEYFKIEEDIVFEIGLTPNRADAASHVGVARDLCAVLNCSPSSPVSNLPSLLLPSVENFKIDVNDLKIEVVVENGKDCIRYSGISISGVEVKESPDWLKNRLKSIGLKPVNNVVDSTNFVLFELGQPLHAFDADKISGKKIVVKNLPANSTFTTLEGTERKLNGSELMICDVEKGLCIAGVFGGINSGITGETKNIFLESACFNSSSIRKTSKYHGLKTDASFRFERGTDPDITEYALKRAAMLIKEICGGKISSDIIDIYPSPAENVKVDYNYKRAERLMGMEIETPIIKNILNQLGIKTSNENSGGLILIVPNYKVDVKREADVVEEIMRIYGYNHVPLPAKMNMPLPSHNNSIKEDFVKTSSQFLIANGFRETLSNSLTKETYTQELNQTDVAVKILNPLSNDLGVMRQTLLFSGLEVIQHNANRKNPDLKTFEFGNSYHHSVSKNSIGYKEVNHLALFVTGNRYSENWIKPAPPQYSIYYFKSILNNLLISAGIEEKNIIHAESENDLFSTSLDVFINKIKIAQYGILKAEIVSPFDVEDDVYYADVLTGELINVITSAKREISHVPKFPEVRRDISMVINKNVKYSDIEKLAFETEKKLLHKVNLFDVYDGENIGSGKISYAISFILLDEEKTLQDKQIESAMERLMNAFVQKLGAEIRR